MSVNELIRKFNRQFPVGGFVRVKRTASSEYELREVTHEAFENGRREAVAGIQGIAGAHSISKEFVDYKFRG